ncbi:MAG: phenylalanine--tRNA ligase subunit beta [Candidatus Thioglobus sp.]|nr:phenylalanine--tRNA ligase subunit beta [Candidatus Thioglobus sp.]
MKISTTWLREWVSPKASDAALGETLTMAGLEVESINPVAPAFEKVIIGLVLTCEKHPDADKLKVCKVSVGAAKPLQIVCGAENIRANLKVIVATVGAKLPSGLSIKKAKIRGLESCGMICSMAEIGIADGSGGIAELAADAPVGDDIRQYLDLDDNIIELDITPNRGDCFSVLGVAREVCANYNLPLKMPKYQAEKTLEAAAKISVSAPDACPKYLTRLIKGIDNSAQTPSWMAAKLTRCGQQLHSPVVDITNFVLLELGTPLHAFDWAKISGGIDVRMAEKNEKIKLLNEQTVSLKSDTLVIADEANVLAIAGVMGGLASSTQANSTDILLESAFFAPDFIKGKAREYALHTESSLRFERGVDFNITELAINRATELVLEICGGEAGEISKCIDTKALPALNPISISKNTIEKVLGFALETNWIEEKFSALDFEISTKDANSWTILPPSFRFDIRITADIIEELARLYGYDKLPVQKLEFTANIQPVSEAKISSYDLAKVLVNRGYQEVITYSFISEKYQNLINPEAKKITLKNPISAELSTMRSSLWGGLLQSVEANQRRGHTNARFFELGLCFEGVKASQQAQKIAGIISGNRFADEWSEDFRELDFYDAKADVEVLLLSGGKTAEFTAAEHPALQKGQTAKITLDGKSVGWIGALSPAVQKQLSLSKCYLFELDLASLQLGNISKYQPFSAYQKTTRDIALVVDEEILANDLINSIKGLGQKYLLDVNLFDVYSGENIAAGKKSLALNLSYQSAAETLSDEQVSAEVSAILELMASEYAAVQRV